MSQDEGIIIVTDLVNTQRAAANAKRRYERGRLVIICLLWKHFH